MSKPNSTRMTTRGSQKRSPTPNSTGFSLGNHTLSSYKPKENQNSFYKKVNTKKQTNVSTTTEEKQTNFTASENHSLSSNQPKENQTLLTKK